MNTARLYSKSQQPQYWGHQYEVMTYVHLAFSACAPAPQAEYDYGYALVDIVFEFYLVMKVFIQVQSL